MRSSMFRNVWCVIRMCHQSHRTLPLVLTDRPEKWVNKIRIVIGSVTCLLHRLTSLPFHFPSQSARRIDFSELLLLQAEFLMPLPQLPTTKEINILWVTILTIIHVHSVICWTLTNNCLSKIWTSFCSAVQPLQRGSNRTCCSFHSKLVSSKISKQLILTIQLIP